MVKQTRKCLQRPEGKKPKKLQLPPQRRAACYASWLTLSCALSLPALAFKAPHPLRRSKRTSHKRPFRRSTSTSLPLPPPALLRSPLALFLLFTARLVPLEANPRRRCMQLAEFACPNLALQTAFVFALLLRLSSASCVQPCSLPPLARILTPCPCSRCDLRPKCGIPVRCAFWFRL